MPRANWAFARFFHDFSHSAVSPRRGDLCWLLEENSLLKSQLGRLQQELREAKKGSRHDE